MTNVLLLLAMLGSGMGELSMTLPGAGLYDAPHGARLADLPAGMVVYPEHCILWQFDGLYEIYAETADGLIQMSKHFKLGDNNLMSIYYVTGQCRQAGHPMFLFVTPEHVSFGARSNP